MQRSWKTDELDAVMVAVSPSMTIPAPLGATIYAPRVVAPPAHPSFFHQLLSELNPLQYVPVLGTIYRAVTGDTIPETARFAGSLVVSGLTGGPVGLAMNIGVTMLEHLLGIDPEKIGGRLLASLNIGTHNATSGAPAPAAVASTPSPEPSPTETIAEAAPEIVAAPSYRAAQATTERAVALATAWSPAQLAAYGVGTGRAGQMVRGTIVGADVLNTLELVRIGAAGSSAPWYAIA